MRQNSGNDSNNAGNDAYTDTTAWWRSWRTTCPSCSSPQLEFSDGNAQCRSCGYVVEEADGVWRFIAGDRLEHFRKFLETYTRVRIAEGRASYDVPTLRLLPQCPTSHSLAEQWRIRARSFAKLMKLLRRQLKLNDRILDLGAGTGWLSHRLNLAAYRPCAIDLSVDAADGLGASRHFESQWPCVQAEFDRLPLVDDQGECVIFNASFHYCTNQEQAILEALRVLVPGGLIIILDTPIYSNESSGRQMLDEQQLYFEQLIGERSDALPSSGFLTWTQLAELADDFGLDWHVERPWYGFRWAVRPLLAKLRGQREPATFAIVWAYKSSSAQTD